MTRWVLALVLLASLPAQAQEQRRICADHRAAFPALLGSDPEAVRAALQALPGIGAVRAGPADMPRPRNLRADRATLIVEGGVVREITCG